MKEKLQIIRYNFELHLTTISKSHDQNDNHESFDGSKGQGSWIPFVRQALSRRTLRRNFKLCCIK